MPIGWDYLAYVFGNTAWLLSCVLACAVFAVLTLEGAKKWDKDVFLWLMVPWTVVTWAVLALFPGTWIWPRLGNPGMSVNFLQTVYDEQKNYDSYNWRTWPVLVVVLGKVTIFWLARGWSPWRLIAVLTLIASLSLWFTVDHYTWLEAYCGDPPGCRFDLKPSPAPER